MYIRLVKSPVSLTPSEPSTKNGRFEPPLVDPRVLVLSLLIVFVGNSSLNVTLPTLSCQLHASTSELQWVVAVYSLVFAGLLFSTGASATAMGARARCSSGCCSSSWPPGWPPCRPPCGSSSPAGP